MQNSNIFIGKDTVTKIASPDRMRIEVEKNLRAFVIANKCGLFKVPQLIDYDENNGVARFKRIHQITPIYELVNGPGDVVTLVEKIGRCLAVIHRELVLPEEMIIPLASEFDQPGEKVFLHGDYNGSNIFLSGDMTSIVILDWQMSSRHGGEATYGNRYFDVIWFLNYFLWSPMLHRLFREPVLGITKPFLKAYFKESGLPYDSSGVLRYAKIFFSLKLPDRIRQANWKTRLLLPRSYILTQKFLKFLADLDITVSSGREGIQERIPR